ncbi:MAG: DUF692 domain-containing protein [Myxococcota bacterium]
MQAGYGLRVPHYEALIERGTRAPFVEAITENFLGRGGRPQRVLEGIRRDARIAFHGVSMSIGAVDPINLNHVDDVAELGRRWEATWISDHLCFSSFGGQYGYDLWPLPYTEEALTHVVERARRVRERLGRPFLLENVSSYVEYAASTLTEWEFMAEIARRADIGILLDVNNVVVSAKNHGFSPEQYIDALPVDRVLQFHLAGHSDFGTHAIDDHGSAVPAEVWGAFRRALARFGSAPSIVEWDDNIPTLERLEAEADEAGRIMSEVLNVAREA